MNRRELLVGTGAVAVAVATGLPAIAETPPVGFPGRPRVDYVRESLAHALDLQDDEPVHTVQTVLKMMLNTYGEWGWLTTDAFIVKNDYTGREAFIRSIMVKIKDENDKEVSINAKTSLPEPAIPPSVLPGEQFPTMRIRIERFTPYTKNA